ncbi:MAG TPA: hypothetical protein VIS74_04075 [Chthoniobacterales bacterium]
MSKSLMQKAEEAPPGHCRIVFHDRHGMPWKMAIHYPDQPVREYPVKGMGLCDFHQQKAHLLRDHPGWRVE